MGVLLDRARKVLGGGGATEVAAPQPYELSCFCGEHVAGYRRDYRQFVACPVCGHLHLVLPASPYPKPIAYETPSGDAAVVVEVVRPVRPLGLRVRLGLRRLRRGLVHFLWSLIPPARWFSPVRLTIMATLLVVAGTIWTTVRWNRRGTLPSDMAAMEGEWTREIEAGDFAQAQKTLEQASAAIRRYNLKARDAREILQLAAEVSRLANLLDQPLADILNSRRTMSDAEAEHYFREKLKNPALVLDTFVAPLPEPETAGHRVDNVIVIGQEKVRMDISTLKLFSALPRSVTRVLFAARIQTIDSGPNAGEWTIRFIPDSAVYLTSVRCVEQVGWPLDDETRALLDSQARLVVEQP